MHNQSNSVDKKKYVWVSIKSIVSTVKFATVQYVLYSSVAEIILLVVLSHFRPWHQDLILRAKNALLDNNGSAHC
jgi:hypothetical protein